MPTTSEREPEPLEPLTLRKRVVEELERPGLVGHLGRISQERTSRAFLTTTPTVIDWVTNPDDPKEFPLRPPEGSVTLYWAQSGSSILKNLEAAYLLRDFEQLTQLHKRLMVEYAQRSVVSVEKATEWTLDAPSFFDFQYGYKQLAGNLYLYNAECGSIVLPYNGGKFNADEFKILEYTRDDPTRSRYDTLVIVSPPKLSAVEQAAVNAVPASQASEHFTAAALCFTACALVTIAVFVTINTAVTTCCSPLQDRLAQVSLPSEMVRRLGAQMSARQLLAMRQEVFEEFGVM